MRVLARVGCLLLFTSFAAGASNVYKWKDANGVTQYSEKPPAGKTYEARRIDERGAPTVEAAAEPTQSADCITARRNLELLSGTGQILQDNDGDGVPETPLDDSQRQAQKELAQASAKAYCKPAVQG